MNSRLFLYLLCVSVVYGCVDNVFAQTAADQAPKQEMVWLYGSFAEINSASPVVGAATMPLTLAKALVDAVPANYVKEANESGFDIPLIVDIVEALPAGEKFELTKNDYHLEIYKVVKTAEFDKKPTSLVIQNEQLRLPIPLILTGTVVKALQLAFKDLKGLDEELAKLVNQIKETPPGILLKGEDRLMNSWLEIRLQ